MSKYKKRHQIEQKKRHKKVMQSEENKIGYKIEWCALFLSVCRTLLNRK